MRVSTHIAHQARKARERAAHHARRAGDAARKAPRHWWVVLGVLLGVVLAVAIVGWRESAAVTGQDYTTPVPCAQLVFTKNVARCEELLLAHFGALHGLDRAPVCGKDRWRYGVAALCDEYDEALAEGLYEGALAERGVSVWEPDAQVSINRTLRVRSSYAINAFSLVCANRIVPAHWAMEGGIITAELLESVNSSCKVIASTAIGSITSEEFNLTTS